jgi:hypothetical protein
MEWMNFWSLTDAQAIARVHPEDRQRVQDTHSRLPGQTLAATVFNLLRSEVVRPSEVVPS